MVCGDGEYIIYTALAWRNRSFGTALEFAWSLEGEYAVRESTSKIKIFNKNFQVRWGWGRGTPGVISTMMVSNMPRCRLAKGCKEAEVNPSPWY